jgi:hypothetical protein
MSGTPDIWITEEVIPATDETAEHARRTTWTVSRYNVGAVGVYIRDFDILYPDSCSRHRSEKSKFYSWKEAVPESHRDALIEALRQDLSGRKHEQTARFHVWDMEIVVPAKE